VRTRDAGPGRALTYVRDGSAVRIDWDDDGDAEHAGRANEVSLSVRTAVVVVVPPGGQGVGDTDGNADERSGGWSALRAGPGENGSTAARGISSPRRKSGECTGRELNPDRWLGRPKSYH
jgi:hypothetical protein